MFSLHSQYLCTTAYVRTHTKSSNSSSGHIAVPLALRNSSEVNSESESETESYITTDSQSASLSWNKAPIWGLRPDFNYCLTVAGLLTWGVLSDKRTGLSFTLAAGPRQRNQSRVRVPWDSRPYITVSDLRLSFSSPPTTRRVTVEVFEPASTRVEVNLIPSFSHILSARTTHRKHIPLLLHGKDNRKKNNIMKSRRITGTGACSMHRNDMYREFDTVTWRPKTVIVKPE
jgi:hypothetical protein